MVKKRKIEHDMDDGNSVDTLELINKEAHHTQIGEKHTTGHSETLVKEKPYTTFFKELKPLVNEEFNDSSQNSYLFHSKKEDVKLGQPLPSWGNHLPQWEGITSIRQGVRNGRFEATSFVAKGKETVINDEDLPPKKRMKGRFTF
ncbi:hypothetical protein RIF29_29256 [Crotalaria pallida]|uniref:Uncharacterized protein n=1 Tax=Crotalaria pallida TaxID=3830 RepID=A0AAN9HTR0_CROPI